MLESSFYFVFKSVIEELERVAEDNIGARPYVEQLSTKSVQDHIYSEYTAIRDELKHSCMNFKDQRRLLDRHKFASIFMIAFMNEVKVEEQYLNQELMAISIGQLILKIVIQDENRKFKNSGILNALDRRGFQYPPRIRDEHDYLYNWALSIHYGRLSGHLSVLSLSNELFWLERYTLDSIGGA